MDIIGKKPDAVEPVQVRKKIDINTMSQMSFPGFVPDREALALITHGDRATAVREEDGTWMFYVSVHRVDDERVNIVLPFNPGGRHVVVDGVMKKWGTIKLGPGVWALAPSILMKDVYNGYLVIRKVPDPAPWELAAVPKQSLAQDAVPGETPGTR